MTTRRPSAGGGANLLPFRKHWKQPKLERRFLTARLIKAPSVANTKINTCPPAAAPLDIQATLSQTGRPFGANEAAAVAAYLRLQPPLSTVQLSARGSHCAGSFRFPAFERRALAASTTIAGCQPSRGLCSELGAPCTWRPHPNSRPQSGSRPFNLCQLCPAKVT